MNKYNVKLGWNVNDDDRIIYAIVWIFARTPSEAKAKALSKVAKNGDYSKEKYTYIKCIKVGEVGYEIA